MDKAYHRRRRKDTLAPGELFLLVYLHYSFRYFGLGQLELVVVVTFLFSFTDLFLRHVQTTRRSTRS